MYGWQPDLCGKTSLLPAGICDVLAMGLLNLRIHKLLQLLEPQLLLWSLQHATCVSSAWLHAHESVV